MTDTIKPFWYAVTSKRAPIIDSTFRRADAAQDYADRQSEMWPDVTVEPLYTRAQLDEAVRKEREACAKVCDTKTGKIIETNRMVSAVVVASECAAAIRARSEQDLEEARASIDRAIQLEMERQG